LAVAVFCVAGASAAYASDSGPGPQMRAQRGATIEPPPDARWQYQLQARPGRQAKSGGIRVDICKAPFLGGPDCVSPEVIDFDLYLDKASTDVDRKPNARGVDALHDRGGYAICYVDAGGIENYRPDFKRFVRWHRRHDRSLLGKPFSKRFPEERWANVGGRKQRRFLVRMMARRVSKCEKAGFDAVEFDVVEAWAAPRRVTGWRVSYADQLKYNRALARVAHRHGLAAGLKNDLGQVKDLVDDFEFAINEECVVFEECTLLAPFVDAGKPVFHIEYEIKPADFCEETEALGFNSIKKGRDFSLYAEPWRPCS
jgi:endo-alpha-1,4-polygalactosaminidase (GH114 family)